MHGLLTTHQQLTTSTHPTAFAHSDDGASAVSVNDVVDLQSEFEVHGLLTTHQQLTTSTHPTPFAHRQSVGGLLGWRHLSPHAWRKPFFADRGQQPFVIDLLGVERNVEIVLGPFRFDLLNSGKPVQGFNDPIGSVVSVEIQSLRHLGNVDCHFPIDTHDLRLSRRGRFGCRLRDTAAGRGGRVASGDQQQRQQHGESDSKINRSHE